MPYFIYWSKLPCDATQRHAGYAFGYAWLCLCFTPQMGTVTCHSGFEFGNQAQNMKKGIDGIRKSIQRVVRANPSVLAEVTAAHLVECGGPGMHLSDNADLGRIGHRISQR